MFRYCPILSRRVDPAIEIHLGHSRWSVDRLSGPKARGYLGLARSSPTDEVSVANTKSLRQFPYPDASRSLPLPIHRLPMPIIRLPQPIPLSLASTTLNPLASLAAPLHFSSLILSFSPWPSLDPLPSSSLASSPSINPGSSRQNRLLLPRERSVAAVASLHVVPSYSLPRFGRSFSAPIAQSRAHNAPIAAPSFRNVVGCRPAKRRSHIESPAVLGARPVLPPSALVVTQELHPSEQCRFLPKSSRRPAAVARL